MSNQRKPIAKKVRFDVFKRDGFVCQYCGAHPPSVLLQIDHIIPVVDGGKNDIDNLVTACQSCNSGKGAGSLEKIPVPLSQRAAEIAEREEQLFAYNKLLLAVRQRIEDEAWEVVEELEGTCEVESYDKRHFDSIQMFLEKLPASDVVKAARIAAGKYFDSNRKFKYFCGICWRVIREGWVS